jgi:ribosomal protein S21
LKDEPGNYLWIREKDGFEESFKKWKKSTDLYNEWKAQEYVQFAEYLGDENEMEKAMKNFVKVSPESWLAKKIQKAVETETNQVNTSKNNWFVKNGIKINTTSVCFPCR